MEQHFAWEPYGDYLNHSRIRDFMDRHAIATASELIACSQQDIAWFWNAALDHLGVEWTRPYDAVYDDSRGMPWTQWFPGGTLNVTHNCIDKHIRDKRGGETALIWEGDSGVSRTVTYLELYDSVCAAAAALQSVGIRSGDVIGLCAPVSPEAVAVMFAAMKIGAVCMQIAARAVPHDVVESLSRGHARLLFMNDAYPRGGKWTDCLPTLRAVEDGAPAVERVILIQRRDSRGDLSTKSQSWPEFLAAGNAAGPCETVPVDAEHPNLILFSSGTTGRSKAIVHTHAGSLAQVIKEVGYAFDCRSNDRFCWFTNLGWMMAPWELMGVLFFGGTVVLYEGTHVHPTPHRVFELIEKHCITIYGFVPTAIRQLAALNEDFGSHDRSSLRILGSTGEILDDRAWLWYFTEFGERRCPIMNVSGGTEVIGCLLSPLPIMPLKPGSLGGAGLGMDLAIVDENGAPALAGPGDLACRKPFPSMTRGFLGERTRFLETYFPHGDDLWIHSDRVETDADGMWFILGRSDDLIIRGSINHDPGKIERALLSYPGSPRVNEAATIGASDPELGQRIVSFVVLERALEGNEVDAVIGALREHVVSAYDRAGRPDDIYVVDALPKNLAAKIPRGQIRRAFEGQPLGDVSKLDNPQALTAIHAIHN
jgi:acetyl-CoA synthetase